MAIVLALLTAGMYGVADFYGGLASRRAKVLEVVAGSHVVGAFGSLIATLVVAERFVVRDAQLGMIGGLFGVVGVGLFYRRLAVGPMSVVAPLTALTAAVLPAAWGVVGGERPTMVGWLGIALALAAVFLVSLSSDSEDNHATVTMQVVVESLLAGAGFGGMFIFLDATSEEAALWPVAASRVLTATILILFLTAVSQRNRTPLIPDDRRSWLLIFVVGVLDTGSNISFVYATNRGQLAVVSVLSALYPVSTVILARTVLGERMTRPQLSGFVVAMSATAFLVLG